MTDDRLTRIEAEYASARWLRVEFPKVWDDVQWLVAELYTARQQLAESDQAAGKWAQYLDDAERELAEVRDDLTAAHHVIQAARELVAMSVESYDSKLDRFIAALKEYDDHH